MNACVRKKTVFLFSSRFINSKQELLLWLNGPGSTAIESLNKYNIITCLQYVYFKLEGEAKDLDNWAERDEEFQFHMYNSPLFPIHSCISLIKFKL